MSCIQDGRQVYRAVLLLLGLMWGCALHAETLTVGILSFRPEAETRTHWQPLVEYLSLAVPGKDFRLRALSYPDLNVAIARKEVDFVFTNPAHYIELRHRANLSGALATVIEDVKGVPISEFGGAIFTQSNRDDITTLNDVSGKRVAIPDASSLGGYHMQVFELVQAGADLPSDSQLMVTGTPHDKVVQAVLSGKADVGFVRAGVIEEMLAEGKLKQEQIRIIHRLEQPGYPYATSTRMYPEWPFIVLSHVDSRDSRRVASALLAIDMEKPGAKSSGPRGFAVPADYSSVEELMRELRVPPFDFPMRVTLMDIWRRYSVTIVVLIVSAGIIMVMLFRLISSNKHLYKAQRQMREYVAQLTRQDTFLRNITENLPALILYWDRDQCCRFANQFASLALKQPKEQLIGMSMSVAIGEMQYARDQEQIDGALHGKPQEYERTFFTETGQTGYFLVNLVPDVQNESVVGYFELVTDITHQKEATEERVAWAISQRDALVREVHHRIKNNLQSVGSLLQKELGGFPAFAPRLQRAMDQLHTLSVVHGLQTGDSGECVALVYTTRQICVRQHDQTARIVVFDVEGMSPRVSQARVVPEEAVAISLILNELITNACKHAPERSTVHVSLAYDGLNSTAIISVRNQSVGHLRDFDSESTQQSGAGLRLMRALLPRQGATLTFRQEAQNDLVAILQISKPIVVL